MSNLLVERQGRPKYKLNRSIVLAESFNGKPLNSPNDLATHPVTKDIFFTDPPYGLNDKENDKEYKQGFKGVYRIDIAYAKARVQAGIDNSKTVVPLKEPQLIFDSFTRPNGIAFSPDGKRMYVLLFYHSYYKRNIITFTQFTSHYSKSCLNQL